MSIGPHNLLLMIVFTGAAVVILLITTALSSRLEPFLRTWLTGTVIIVLGPFASAIYYMNLVPWVGALAFSSLVVGIGVKALAAIQFRTGRLQLGVMAPAMLAVTAAVTGAIFSGYDGLSIILWQGWMAACGLIAAANYHMARAEAPMPLGLLTGFYLLYALAFGLSAATLLADGSLVLGGPPDTFADKVSRVAAVVALLGCGSMLLVLNHRRSARHAALPA
ncbi:MAG: hypothetical protein KDK07_02710 [Bauldia sp.]|nr:hypothetical protein [Bauldia sp.]